MSEVIRAVELTPEQQKRLTELLAETETHEQLAFKLKMEARDVLMDAVRGQAHAELVSGATVEVTADRKYAVLVRERER